jgi:hypothetical protein
MIPDLWSWPRVYRHAAQNLIEGNKNILHVLGIITTNTWEIKIQRCDGYRHTVEFHSIQRSRVTHPLCRDEFWSRSRVTAPSAECKMRDTGAKSSLEVQRRQNFRIFFVLNAEFLEVSCQNSLVAEVLNRYFGSRVTTRAELNEILQY